jgi:hypothetical protein
VPSAPIARVAQASHALAVALDFDVTLFRMPSHSFIEASHQLGEEGICPGNLFWSREISLADKLSQHYLVDSAHYSL